MGILTARTTNAKPVSKQHMHRILRSPFYSGIMKVNGELYPHRYDRLIAPDLYQRCQAVLEGKNHKRNRTDKKTFAFKGALQCAQCGCTFSSETKKGRCTYLRPIKAKPASCDCKQLREEVVLEQVADILRTLTIPQELMELVRHELRTGKESEKEYHRKSVQLLQKEHKKTEERLGKLLDVLHRLSMTKKQKN